jgi:hypothetical protein
MSRWRNRICALPCQKRQMHPNRAEIHFQGSLRLWGYLREGVRIRQSLIRPRADRLDGADFAHDRGAAMNFARTKSSRRRQTLSRSARSCLRQALRRRGTPRCTLDPHHDGTLSHVVLSQVGAGSHLIAHFEPAWTPQVLTAGRTEPGLGTEVKDVEIQGCLTHNRGMIGDGARSVPVLIHCASLEHL